MRILFAGPSLAGAEGLEGAGRGSAGLVLRGPAQQGDLVRAIFEGATVIGLIDGFYEAVAAVWHKEILFALAEGVQVFGAASMGAMRAAECAPFGMIGVGEIYRQYASGELDDDAAVAQIHAPAELGYMPLTEALVNVRATIAALLERDLVTDSEAQQLAEIAARQHFKERTYARIAAALGMPDERRVEIAAAIASNKRDVKRSDAEELVRAVLAAPAERGPPPSWQLSHTTLLKQLIHQARSGRPRTDVGPPAGAPALAAGQAGHGRS